MEHGTPGEQGEGDGEDAVHLEEGNINTKDKGNMGYAKEFMANTAAKLRDWTNSPRKQSATSPSGQVGPRRRANLPVIKDKAAVKNKDKLAKALHVASRLRARGLKRPSIELTPRIRLGY